MAENPLEAFRLSLMQDALPVGLAMVERAQKGGIGKIAKAFNEFSEPWQALKNEGEPAAHTLRKELDKVMPGLGNPVVSVKVEVDSEQSEVQEILNQEPLMQCLKRIEADLDSLESLLEHSRENPSSKAD